MAEIIRMPKMSDTMTEGVIAAWHKKVGDEVESGDILAEVETDKATMELESYDDGVLLHIGIEEKASVPVDGVIAIIGEEGEDISALLKDLESGGNGSAAKSAKKEEAAAAAEEPAEEEEAVDTSSINAEVIRMPKMSDTMTEGTIAAWHKEVGDTVEAGDILAEVETDKATMELESYDDGVLLYIGVQAGDAVAVDGVLAVIGEEGADYEALLKGGSNGKKKSKKSDTAEAHQDPKPVLDKALPTHSGGNGQENTSDSSDDDSRVKASPLARKMAKDKGISLNKVKGTGENGRVVRRDIESFKPEAASAQTKTQSAPAAASSTPVVSVPVGEESYEEVTVSQMRKAISRRLSESKFQAPHFYLTMSIDMDKAMAARASINEYIEGKVSFNDLVIKAAAVALRKHPDVNASYMGDTIRKNHHVHIGMAVAIPDGLMVPVIKFADSKSLTQISAEAKDMGKRAKEKKLKPEEYQGNTFTISNLGMFGIDEFTAIVNPPDACILAVGGISQVPVVKDGQVVPGNVMKVTLSCDHRVVDGSIGAAFLNTFKGLLEDPVRILA